jgi:glycosyltransferase involved in cell wall biosynthesis
MTIKVLHLFPPDYKTRFGGQIITWKYDFSRWNDPDVTHYVLDYQALQIEAAKEAFNFELPEVRKQASRFERAAWIIPLFISLNRIKKEYDILHVHVLLWGGLLIGPWAKLNKIPAVYESILYLDDTPSGISREKLSKIKLACLRSYKRIFSISKYMTKDYRKFGFRTDQAITLTNSVDTDLFSPASAIEQKKTIRETLGLPAQAVVVLFVGSVIKRKGVDVLINAFIGANEQRTDLFMVIVGPLGKALDVNDVGFAEHLRDLLEERKLTDKTLFTGLIQDNQLLADYYRAADIFVFPSTNEGLGNVILEAMASALPVVATQLPVIRNIIKHGENGLYVQIGDVEAVKDSILSLSNDPAQAKRLGVNARNFVQDNLNFAGWQYKIVELYRNMLDSGV